MNLIAFNASSIGASHIRIGKECQDYSLSDVGDDWCIAITCDGHGGDNYFRSSLGSRFAAETAMRCIGEFLSECGTSELTEPDAAIIQLEKSIIAGWNDRVWSHFGENAFTEEELNSISQDRRKRLLAGKSIESTYGTTLIAVAWTHNFWFGIQIGDGKAVRIKPDGSADCPIPKNAKCFLNTTTSICDVNAIDNFRHCYSTDLPAGIFCGSDGIDDSFIRDEQLFRLYLTIGRSFADNELDVARNELEEYLPRLSSKGSGDDVSIAGIIDMEIADDAFPSVEGRFGEGEAPSMEGPDSTNPVVTSDGKDTVQKDSESPETAIREYAKDRQSSVSGKSELGATDALGDANSSSPIIAGGDNPETSIEDNIGAEIKQSGDAAFVDSSMCTCSEEGEESNATGAFAEIDASLGAVDEDSAAIESQDAEESPISGICPNCGAETKGEYRFCPNCATPLKG